MIKTFELANLTFSLNDTVLFFKDISLSFPAGKIHCISGDNGVGKSTFFRIIRGKIKKGESISGKFFLDQSSYDCQNNRVPELFFNHVKTLSQQIDSLLVGPMTVSENMSLARIASQSLFQKFIPHAALDQLLANAGFDSSTIVNRLSGGQKQLLAFVMGYQMAGTIFLLDEPTAALDKTNRNFLMDAIANLARTKKLVIIMITHDQELVKQYCTGYHYAIVKTEDQARTFIAIK